MLQEMNYSRFPLSIILKAGGPALDMPPPAPPYATHGTALPYDGCLPVKPFAQGLFVLGVFLQRTCHR